MKLFYTEEEAIEDGIIQLEGQEYVLSIYELDKFVPPHSGFQNIPYIKSQYIRKEVFNKGNIKVFYVLEQFENEALSMILKAYNIDKKGLNENRI